MLGSSRVRSELKRRPVWAPFGQRSKSTRGVANASSRREHLQSVLPLIQKATHSIFILHSRTISVPSPVPQLCSSFTSFFFPVVFPPAAAFFLSLLSSFGVSSARQAQQIDTPTALGLVSATLDDPSPAPTTSQVLRVSHPPSRTHTIATPAQETDAAAAAVAPLDSLESAAVPGIKRHGVPTKDAPVDGKDGKPHLGPFVETDNIPKPAPKAGTKSGTKSGTKPGTETEPKELPILKGRPDDPTIVDGKKIPETNDGIMFDKNREHAQEGTTGLEGGVTEKDKARKAEEGRTGEKVTTKPEAPKEQPPLPHSEEEKIRGSTKEKDSSKSSSDKDDDTTFTKLDKPEDLPDRPLGATPPVPNSANKDHLDIIKPPKGGAKKPTDEHHEDDDSIIQPFHSFILSLTMILVSEVGDKTFLVAALMAMKHDRLVVFTAAFGALLVMTVLSALPRLGPLLRLRRQAAARGHADGPQRGSVRRDARGRTGTRREGEGARPQARQLDLAIHAGNGPQRRPPIAL
ncbi:hypothetical protein G7046_g9633 [Stylonectria norvegica]|nr:hypothetical protein G7046_g9633 [Stylonectria norvegica]